MSGRAAPQQRGGSTPALRRFRIVDRREDRGGQPWRAAAIDPFNQRVQIAPAVAPEPSCQWHIESGAVKAPAAPVDERG
ncbi:MAG: hypothetical protein KGL15_05275 [Acidobacteriota bacterium]|nr:hypothetical protein [Acidobacteriota bacterium]